MKIQELRALSNDELKEKLKKLKTELFRLNLQRYGGNVEKPHLFSATKRDIARISTLLKDTKGK